MKILNLIFRGECLNNNTCKCQIFYGGDYCENYIGCPNTIDSQICTDVLAMNRVDQTSLDNEDTITIGRLMANNLNSSDYNTCHSECTTKYCISPVITTQVQVDHCSTICETFCQAHLQGGIVR